jgi:hypothetical protein
MQRFIRRTLTGTIALLLVSCGGGSPEPAAPPVQVDRAAAAVTAKSTILSARSDTASRAARTYIVQLREPPVASYDGGINGHAATRPARGSKIDADNADVAGYRGHLRARQDAVLRSVGGAKALHNYSYVFNGFAARISEAQALKLAATPGVLTVSPDEKRTADTSSTPTFLGLTGKDGFWKENDAKGEDIIIGVVDSGIWPQHPSFSDRDRHGEVVYDKIHHWKGTCVTGDQFDAKDCNRKLIGARYYNAGFGGNEGIKKLFPYEFVSPRDYDGHGTHTSSTAGGNEGVAATGAAAVFGKINGIAPRARLAMYKALWHDNETATSSGFNSDLVAAIDDAVADGVDVINYSISGTATNFLDPVELAFLRAADAGVFVAASAGNSGPTTSTVAHPSPWITTVAAGTHNRDGVGSATLGNGVVLNGSSVAAAVASKSLINATDAVVAGGDPVAARLCFSAIDNGGPAVLDPAKVAGKIVVCDRGVNARVSKSQAVLEAGGVGMLLLNLTPNSINADLHFVPTVHLADTVAAAVHTYAASAGATASIAQATITFTTPAPFTASFSSRGPLRAGSGDLLKPDVIAPGQDILAGVAPPNNSGRLFDVYSGTSMSSPHVAGLAALMKEVHPKWSPMAIKSALMTSAGDVLDGPNTNPLVIFRQGAGHVQPNNAADPGLVFDSAFEDWAGFLCGTQLGPDFCVSNGIAVLTPSDLNMPSIAIGALAGTQTVKRRVTNVSDGHATYTASVTGMDGFQVQVSPPSLTLHKGETKSFTVTFTRTSAALRAYTGGQLTLTGGTSKKKSEQRLVRIPVVVQPVALAAPAEVNGSFSVKFGYTGPFTATPRGLVAAATSTGSVATDAFVDFPITIPAGTTYARFSLFDSDVSQPSDLDLEVRNSSGTLVGASGSGTSAEEVNLVNPPAGVYTVRVIGFATGSSATTFTLFNWSLGSTDAGNMTVSAPTSATTGASGNIGLAFTGLTAGLRYLGSVVYGGDPAVPGPTIVRVNP